MNRNKTEQTKARVFFFAGGSLSASLSLDDAADALLPDSLSATPRLLAGRSLIASR